MHFNFEEFNFLNKANLRDAAGRKIDDENYDKTSL
jgi:hypothetical protein